MISIHSVRGWNYGLTFFGRSDCDAGGERLSLFQIENRILRREFSDPGIHLAITCGSKSCPPLNRRLFEPDLPERQLHDVTVEFLNYSGNVLMDREGETVHLSRIFKWDEKDFGPDKQAILDFIGNYNRELGALLAAADPGTWKVGYNLYDWSLNNP